MNRISLKSFFIKYTVLIVTELCFMTFGILHSLHYYNHIFEDLFATALLQLPSVILGFHISRIVKKTYAAIIIQLFFAFGFIFLFYKIASSYFYTRLICICGILLALIAIDFFTLSFIHGKDKFGKVILVSVMKSLLLSVVISIVMILVFHFLKIDRHFDHLSISLTIFVFVFTFLYSFFSTGKGKRNREDSEENREIIEIITLCLLGMFIILTYIYIIFMYSTNKLNEIQGLTTDIILGYMISYFLLKELSGKTGKIFFRFGSLIIIPIYAVLVFVSVKIALSDGCSTKLLAEIYFEIVALIFFVLIFIKKGSVSHFILPVISVLALVSTVTPLNCKRLAVRNHLYRIEKIYKNHDLYCKTQDGKIYFNEMNTEEILSDKEKQQVAFDFEYFNWNDFNDKEYQSFLKNSFLEGQDTASIYYADLFQSLCGFELEMAKYPYEMIEIPGKDYFISRTEITQGQYYAVMELNPSSNINKYNPVENVSWYDAVYFCNKLSIKKGLTPAYRVNGEINPDKWGYAPNPTGSTCHKFNRTITLDKTADGFRLPTIFEWEYAAVGGKNFDYSGSDNADEVAWHGDNSNGITHKVAEKKPNNYGLYDMCGNVSEFVWETHPKNSFERFIRGGGANDGRGWCKLNVRELSVVDAFAQYKYRGFRIVRSKTE